MTAIKVTLTPNKADNQPKNKAIKATAPLSNLTKLKGGYNLVTNQLGIDELRALILPDILGVFDKLNITGIYAKTKGAVVLEAWITVNKHPKNGDAIYTHVVSYNEEHTELLLVNKEIAAAKAVLEKYGYVTEPMWHLDEAMNYLVNAGIVSPGVRRTKERCRTIVSDALKSPAIVARIEDIIHTLVQEVYPSYARYLTAKQDEENE